jgi:hypothetical protein
LEHDKRISLSDLIDVLGGEEEVQKSIVIDVFSLCFLKGPKGEYLCGISKIRSILEQISGFITDDFHKYFSSANSRLVVGRICGKNKLDGLLVSTDNMLFDLIKSGDLDAGYSAAETRPRTQAVIGLLRQLQSGVIMEEDEGFLGLEKFFTTNSITKLRPLPKTPQRMPVKSHRLTGADDFLGDSGLEDLSSLIYPRRKSLGSSDTKNDWLEEYVNTVTNSRRRMKDPLDFKKN